MTRSLLLILLLLPSVLLAQFTYTIDQQIPVVNEQGQPFNMPWAGGINAAQYNTMDLNNDNKPDLVLFDRMANTLMTYLSDGSQYQYAPEYESLFPDSLTNWMLLRDFNCDGKKDIFTGDILGIKVFLNTTQAGENLSWKPITFYATDEQGNKKSDVLLTKGSNGFINLQLQYDDLPSITDADGDGDLDIFSMKYTGNSSLEYHRNNSFELYGRCDSLSFERVTSNWGLFTECLCGSFAFNSTPCTTPDDGRVEHAGGKAVTIMDVDGDNDLDVLFSQASCNNLYLLENKGTTAKPIIDSYSLYPSSKPVNLLTFPAGFYEDVDFDGIPDLIATPNIYTKGTLSADLSASNWYYKNTGTKQLPSFQFKQDDFLQNKMIDVGDNAVPAFADFDGDGDLDLFVSENFTPSNRSSIYQYENTGTPQAPAFKLITDNYLGFAQSNFYNLKIRFVDIDSDGKTDLVFTASSAEATTNKIFIYYLLNISTSNTLKFNGQTVRKLSIALDFNENICVADVGKDDGSPDGKADILIGRSTGALEYWQNDGNVNFTLVTNTYLGLGTSILRQNPATAIGDLDGDANDDLIITDQSGALTIISDYHKAKDISSGVTNIFLSPLQDSIYVPHKLGGRLWPTVVDLFKTNKPAIVVGNLLGGVRVLKHTEGSIVSEHPLVAIYPNPVQQAGELIIAVDRTAMLQIYSSIGQHINTPVLISANEQTKYLVNTLARGVYIFKFTFNDTSPYVARIVVY